MRTAILIVLVLAIAVALWFSLRKPSALDQSLDAQVVEQLQKANSDLNKPHEVEFFLYFPTEEGARNVAQKATESGFKVEVRPAAGGSLPWLAFATRNMIITVVEMEKIRSHFTALCEAESGEYDGWGAPVVK